MQALDLGQALQPDTGCLGGCHPITEIFRKRNYPGECVDLEQQRSFEAVADMSIGVQSGPLIGAQKGPLCPAGSRPEAAELSGGADGSGRRGAGLRRGS